MSKFYLISLIFTICGLVKPSHCKINDNIQNNQNTKLKNKFVDPSDEEKKIAILKKAFEDDEWIIYFQGVPNSLIKQYCNDAYQAYLKYLLVKHQYENGKASENTLHDQTVKMNHKCKLCVFAIDVFHDNKQEFIEKYGYKFIQKTGKK